MKKKDAKPKILKYQMITNIYTRGLWGKGIYIPFCLFVIVDSFGQQLSISYLFVDDAFVYCVVIFDTLSLNLVAP